MNSQFVFRRATMLHIMEITDSNFVFTPAQGTGKTLFILLLLIAGNVAQNLFESGKEYVYFYDATSNTGVLVPSNAASSWSLRGKLVIQAEDDYVTVQLQSLKTSMWNGNVKESSEDIDIYDDALELLKPFQLSYNKGLIENFSVEAEPVWATNIKRSIAGILQLDLLNLKKEVAFHATEINHYGQCDIDYVVSPGEENQHVIRKSLDPRMCIGHPCRNWSNVPKVQCTDEDQNLILKSSERIYKLRSDGSVHNIISVNASGSIYVTPFQNMGEAHYHFVQQTIQLSSTKDVTKKIITNNLRGTLLQHELPEADLTQGRSTLDKSFVFKSISDLLDRLSYRLENPGLDTDVHNLHNTTISVLLYYLGMLDRADLGKAYSRISGTSYKEETIRNMFLETLPQVGSKESALFILDLVRQGNKVSDISAIQLLMRLPFHIRKLDTELLVSLQPLLALPNKVSTEVQNTAILMFGTLIYKTCLVYCPPEMLDDYVRLYLDRFTETTQYGQKMVWLEGLANIQLGRVVEFLEPIASGNNAESRHFRVLAAWASLPTAPLRPDVIYPVYWPILMNRTEHLEMRVAALTLLVASSPTPSRLISLYWYIKSEPSQHLYNYFYTMLKSMERSTYPCYKRIGRIAAQFSHILRKPSDKYLITGNYVVDYQDSLRRFGAMLNGIVVANPATNIPEVLYVTLNNYGSGTHVNHVSLYVKAEGIFHSLTTSFDPTNIRDILKEFKLDERRKGPVHLEIITRIQEKTVLCVHWNETSIVDGLKYLSSLSENIYHMYQNMEFHVNQQRINVPLTMESVQVTDFGTNVRLAVTGTSLFSMRGNFTRDFPGRNNHVILRTSVHGIEMIENYNPLVDLWHSAERFQSLHGYLPINVTMGLDERPFISYDTLGGHRKTGIATHAKTVTSIRGAKVRSKLERVCRSCPMSYTVTKSSPSNPQTINVLNVSLPELGGRLQVNVFDCENAMSYGTLINDVWSSHQSNHQTWPSMKFPLIGLHILDYFTYMPPKGSCGLAAYIEALRSGPSQTRLEYLKNGKHHMFSLAHYDLELSEILHQWNLAALYERSNWLSDVLKIKASKFAPGERIFKLCVEAERDLPWQWMEVLSNEPSDSLQLKLNIAWELSDTAKGKCSGSSILLNLIGEISSEQLEESKRASWPYDECRKESTGKTFVPYTNSCYEVSKELSTLRKYKILGQYENLPEGLSKLIWRMQAVYDLIGGNSSNVRNSNEILMTATFPKDSSVGKLQVNENEIAFNYNSHYINPFLARMRIHQYMELPLFRMFSSTCIITSNSIKSTHNVVYTFAENSEVILLGQCYDENPRLVLTAANSIHGINVNLTDESGTIQITAGKDKATLYNATSHLQLQSNFVFHTLGTKKIKTSDKAIDIVLPNILLYMHWTQEQVLLFFPNHVLEFSCGICTLDHSNVNRLYEKL